MEVCKAFSSCECFSSPTNHDVCAQGLFNLTNQRRKLPCNLGNNLPRAPSLAGSEYMYDEIEWNDNKIINNCYGRTAHYAGSPVLCGDDFHLKRAFRLQFNRLESTPGLSRGWTRTEGQVKGMLGGCRCVIGSSVSFSC